MLVLTRKKYESIYIGDDVRITVVECSNDKVRIGVEAPKHLSVDREEVWVKKDKERRTAQEPRQEPGQAEESVSRSVV
jgi:carbon storage regulator